MQEMGVISDEPPKEVNKSKKRIRRRMVNGVLVSRIKPHDRSLQDMDEDNSIRDIGEDCQCKRYRCFEVTTQDERLRVFRWFRHLGSVQMQDLYLSNLITVEGIKQRRNRQSISDEKEVSGKKSIHSCSFFYRLKIPDVDQRGYRELNVCRVAFLAILGISRNRLRLTQKMLYHQMKQSPLGHKLQFKLKAKETQSADDLAVPEAVETLILVHIDNYALSETYSVKEMHKNFLRSYRINVPYQVYWLIFHAKWNIGKFQPRYTCMPTFDTFYETLSMFGLVDFSKD